jgi:hypothetical protein
MQVRLYGKPPGKGQMGLGGGYVLRTVPIREAQEIFASLTESKALLRLLPAGADNALKK